MKFAKDWILYEDNHLICVKKLPGILSQEDISGDPDILTLTKNYLKSRDSKPGNVYLGLVHRLDRNTGGVLCLAKTSKAASRLSEQIRMRQWEKEYFVLTQSETEPKDTAWSVWEDELVKDREENRSTSAKDKQGKKAWLEQRRIQSLYVNGSILNLRQVKLGSGRSHQIRVQCQLRGETVVGDSKYGAEKSRSVDRYFLGLWAWRLQLIHPVKKEPLDIQCLPPNDGPWKFFRLAIRDSAQA